MSLNKEVNKKEGRGMGIPTYNQLLYIADRWISIIKKFDVPLTNSQSTYTQKQIGALIKINRHYRNWFKRKYKRLSSVKQDAIKVKITKYIFERFNGARWGLGKNSIRL